jgi:outer membrane protein OmpA-like peptidoglycan-associated protein
MPGDARGCYEPAGVKRFPGSKLVHCDNRDFDEITIGTGKMTAYDIDLGHPTYEAQADTEGRSTVSAYALPRGTTPGDAWVGYKAELAATGYQILYEGKEPDIGSSVAWHFGSRNGLEQTFQYSGSDTGHYVAAVKNDGARKTYVTVYALSYFGGVTPGLALEKNQTIVRVQSVEANPVVNKMGAPAPGTNDAGGCKDPVGLKRFQGSTLAHCDNRNFAEVTMGTSKMSEFLIDAKKPVFETQLDLEGRSSVNAYVLPLSASPADAWRNYKLELESEGYKVLHEARDLHMGDGFGYQYKDANGLSQTFGYSRWGRYGVAVKDEGERKTYVSVYAIEFSGGVTPNHVQVAKGQTIVRVESMETGKLEDKMTLVDAGAIEKSIAGTGKIAIYGINFDFNKSNIKPESRPVLDEIGKFLKDNPSVKLSIVGHTDSIGGADFNMRLSQARAIAVVNDLVSVYGIEPARLASQGAGLAKPVAPNDTDEGRAKNRRVELVKM